MERIIFNISIGLVTSILSLSVYASDFKAQLTGERLLMDGASCAGLYLKNDKVATMYSETDCKEGLALRVRWLNNSTFVLVEKNKPNDISPPRTFIYEVKSVKGKQVTLNEIWTGWNEFKDSQTKYSIK